MANIQSQIESRIHSFVAELNTLVRHAALDAVRGALGDGAPVKRGPGRPRKIAATIAPRTASAPAPKAARASKGGKRSPALLEKTVEALRQYVVSHPGRRIEQIAPALSVKTKDLALPVQKLLAAKSISKKGHKRSTTYWPLAKK